MVKKVDSQEEVLKRWPRITAHLIAESLGYFTPRSAANAILNDRRGEGFWCEWYMHIASFDKSGNSDVVVRVGREQLRRAIKNRKYHSGFMASYDHARQVIEACKKGVDPIFASWF